MFRTTLNFIALFILLSAMNALNTNGQTAPQKTSKNSALEAELRGLYEKLLVASKDKDIETLTKILSDNYSQVTADGRVRTKAIRLKETLDPDDKTEILALESFDLFIYENAAVGRCRVRNKGTSRGEGYDVKILSTVTFVKEGKMWRIAATHLTFQKE